MLCYLNEVDDVNPELSHQCKNNTKGMMILWKGRDESDFGMRVYNNLDVFLIGLVRL